MSDLPYLKEIPASETDKLEFWRSARAAIWWLFYDGPGPWIMKDSAFLAGIEVHGYSFKIDAELFLDEARTPINPLYPDPAKYYCFSVREFIGPYRTEWKFDGDLLVQNDSEFSEWNTYIANLICIIQDKCHAQLDVLLQDKSIKRYEQRTCCFYNNLDL